MVLVYNMNRIFACRALARQLTTTARAQSGKELELHPKYLAIRKQYARFQENNGVPVHLKGGTFDRILYGATISVQVIGVIVMLEFFYSQINK